jgi:predicted transcriptional regulator
MKEELIIIGDLLKKRRDEAGFGPSEVADVLKIDRKQVYRYEKDEQYPDVDKIKKLSDLYKCDLFGDIAKKYGLQDNSNDNRIEVVEQYLESIQSKIGEFKEKISSWKVNSDDPQEKNQKAHQEIPSRRKRKYPEDRSRASGDKLKAQDHLDGQGKSRAKGK